MEMRKDEQKNLRIERETIEYDRKIEEYTKQEEISLDTKEPYVQPDLLEEFSVELENDTEFDDFEK